MILSSGIVGVSNRPILQRKYAEIMKWTFILVCGNQTLKQSRNSIEYLFLELYVLGGWDQAIMEMYIKRYNIVTTPTQPQPNIT